jgi:signal transduction histidine kinase
VIVELAKRRLVGAARLLGEIVERWRAEQRLRAVAEMEHAARTEAERVGRMKDELLMTVSHELRTPLTALLGWTQLIQRGSVAPAELPHALRVLEMSARAQTEVVTELLESSRIHAGTLRLRLEPVEITALAQAALDAARPMAEAKRVALTSSVQLDAGVIRADPERIHQVLWHLLSNAVKFTPLAGRVDFTVGRVGGQVRIAVRDTGMGIDAEFLPHIFDRFRLADASTRRRHRGLGLGLFIAKQLVDMHGGVLTAASAGVGQGATLEVLLPLLSPESRARP